jgi:nitrogen regulatory protein PII
VSEVRAEHDGGRTLLYRGVAYHGYESRLKIETLVPDSDAMPVVHAILSASRALDSLDHTVAVSPVENVQSIGITSFRISQAQPLPRL